MSAQLVKELRERTGAGILDCKKALTETNNDMNAAIDWLLENGIAKAAKKGDRVAAEGLTAIKVDGNEAILIEVNSETDFVAKNEQFLNLIADLASASLAAKATTKEEAEAAPMANGTVADAIVQATATIGEKIDLRRVAYITKTDSQSFGNYSHMGGRIGVITVVEGGSEEVAKDIALQVAALVPNYSSREEMDAAVVAAKREELLASPDLANKPEKIWDKIVDGQMTRFFKEALVLPDMDFVKDDSVSVEKYLSNNSATLVSYTRYEVGEGIEKVETDFAAEVAASMTV